MRMSLCDEKKLISVYLGLIVPSIDISMCMSITMSVKVGSQNFD